MEIDVLTPMVSLWLLSIGVAEALAGNEFYVTFMGLDSHQYLTGYTLTAQIFVSNPNDTQAAQVEVSYVGVPSASTETLSLVGGASEEVTMSTAVILSGAAKHEACAVVTSDSPVLVQASLEYVQHVEVSMAGYPVLPVTSLTGDYIVATHCVTNKCVFVVTSAEDGNAVEVHIRTDGAGSALYSGTQYSDGEQFEEILNKGESLQVTCDACDLTGTSVHAARRVTVLGGGDFTRYDTVRENQDGVCDVMLPLESLGQQYVLGSGHSNLYEIVKVVVPKDGDSFSYNGVQQPAATKDRQVYVMPTRAMSDVVRLESSSPVLVLEVMAGLDKDTPPDMSMTLALPVVQWTSSYRVYLPADQTSLTLSLITDSSSPSFTTNINSSQLYSSVSGNSLTTTTSMEQFPGGAFLNIKCQTPCRFSGFLIRNKHDMSSILPLMPRQLKLETTEATTTEAAAATTTETETATATVATAVAAALSTHSFPSMSAQTVSQASSPINDRPTSQPGSQPTSDQATTESSVQATAKSGNQATEQFSSQPTSDQATTESNVQVTAKSGNQATEQFSSQPTSDQATTESSVQATAKSGNQATEQFSNQPTSDQATTESITQAQSGKEATAQPGSQPTNEQSTTESSVQTTAQSSNEATPQSGIKHTSDQATTQTSTQATAQSGYKATDQSGSQPTSDQATTESSTQATTQSDNEATAQSGIQPTSDQATTEPSTQATSQSGIHPTSDQATTESSTQVTTQSDNEATAQSGNEATAQSGSQPTSDQATTESRIQATAQSGNEATALSGNEATAQSGSQPTSDQATTESRIQATAQSGNQATAQSSIQPTIQYSDQDPTQSFSQAITQSSNQANTHASNEPIYQNNDQSFTEVSNEDDITTHSALSSVADITTHPAQSSGADIATNLAPRSTPQSGVRRMGCGSNSKCHCLVYSTRYNNIVALNNSALVNLKTEIENELLVDRKSLSSYIRRKSSAANEKPSSVYVGSAFGAAVFVTAFAVVVLPDLLSLARHVVRRACRPHEVTPD